MRTGPGSLGDSLRAGEDEWLQSRMLARASAASMAGDDGGVSIAVESDLLRTVLLTMLLGALAALLGFFSFRASAGGGRSIFMVGATLAAFLACGAVASRRRPRLRVLLALGSLSTFALLVDQFAYYSWNRRVDRLVTTLRQGIESGSPVLPNPLTVPPTSFFIDPDREVLLTFEPPPLAWTYYLDSASPLGHTLVAGWYGILSSATRGRHLGRVAQSIVHPHAVYSIGLKSDDKTLACREGETERWTLLIETRSGDRRL